MGTPAPVKGRCERCGKTEKDNHFDGEEWICKEDKVKKDKDGRRPANNA